MTKRILSGISILILISLLRFDLAKAQTLTQSSIAFERAWPDSLIGKGIAIKVFRSNADGEIFAGSWWDGLWKSTDRGKTWHKLPYVDDTIRDLFITSNGAIFSVGYRLFRSVDNGITWERLDTRLPGIRISFGVGFALHEKPNGDLLLGWNEGIFQSTDNGETWLPTNSGLPKWYRTIHPYDTTTASARQFASRWDTIFVCTGGSDFYPEVNGIYRTTDGGISWSESYEGIPRGHPVRAITATNGVLFAGGELYNIRGLIPQRGIWRSLNGGLIWELSALDNAVWTLEANRNGHVYAGNGDWKGVYRTTNLGATWEHLGLDGLNVFSILFLSDTTFLVGSDDGIFRGRPNRQPIIQFLPHDTVAQVGYAFEARYNVSDPDGDQVQLSISTSPFVSWLVLDTVGNRVWGTPQADATGQTIRIQLKATDAYGATQTAISQSIRVSQPTTVQQDPIVLSFSLLQNYPNPFNSMTTIEFNVPTKSHIRLSVTNVVGIQVAILREGLTEPGHHLFTWDASPLPSGVYFYRLEAAGFTPQSRKLILIR